VFPGLIGGKTGEVCCGPFGGYNVKVIAGWHPSSRGRPFDGKAGEEGKNWSQKGVSKAPLEK